jgi:hypothetical protein
MGIRWWIDALTAVWSSASCVSELSDWLRRDIGLTKNDLRSRSEHVDEIRRKYGGWV